MPEHQALTEVPKVVATPPTRPTPFTVFDAATGEILRSGTTQFQTLSSQSISPNEIVLEGEYQDNLFTIEVNPDGPVPVAKGESNG